MEEWRQQVYERHLPGVLPHSSNLVHQLRERPITMGRVVTALELIVPEYIRFVDSIENLDMTDDALPIDAATDILERYLWVVRQPEANCFASVADFITSIVPEFLIRIFRKMISVLGLDLEALGQKDVPIEISFVPNSTTYFLPRLQRVDVAVVKRLSLSIDGHALENFSIPVYVCESKTYFDKNMISGVAYSSEALKSTFPGCVCVSVGEWADFNFEAQSYAGSAIDEIYILRNQRRSDFRRGGKPQSISTHTMHLILYQAREAFNAYRSERITLQHRMDAGRLIG